jgi:hypothetical protein
LEEAPDLVSPPLFAGVLGDDGEGVAGLDESPPAVSPPPPVLGAELSDPESDDVESPAAAFFVLPERLSVL